MAHYAFLNQNNIVTDVIVGKDETELIEGIDPETWYGNFRGQVCKRTSYNTSGNQHPNNTPFRFNFASVGDVFDPAIGPDGAFYTTKPFGSFVLNKEKCLWEAPVAYPSDGKVYGWFEPNQEWIEIK